MPLGSPNMGIGEYLTTYVILGVLAVGVIGYFFGVAGTGALLFVVAGTLIVLLVYAILSRAYRFLLHGSVSGGGGE